MNKVNLRLLFTSLILVVLLAMGTLSGCITITTPSTTTPPTVTTAITPPIPINPTWTPPSSANTTTTATSTMLPNIADVVALVKPSVVAITTEVVALDFFNRPITQEGAGSGWIIDSNGIIVTNNHVIEGASTITVTMDDGTTYTVDNDKVFTDSLNDLAILRIDAQNLPALKICDSCSARVGQWVVAVGNALGQGIRATEGIISRQGVSIPVAQNQTLYDLIETTAAINPGNSGGPLVNMAGEVIGITSLKIATSGVEGMGYAISTATALPIIQELVNNGYVVRPWLGVSLYTINEWVAMRYELAVDKGVLLTEVGSDTPAAKTGLEAGDIIVSLGGKEVSTVEELTRALHASEIGQPIAVTYWRGDSKYTTEVIPAESPPPP